MEHAAPVQDFQPERHCERHNIIVTFLLRAAMAAGAIALTLAFVSGLYLIKSALGINLMDGPSPLHDLLYPLIK